MAQQAKFYLTTPIYYVNARPHLGHTYTTVVADVVARWHRAQGDDTFFLTGTDEHGQKIQRSAALQKRSPQEFADEVSGEFRALWDQMGLTYDDYIRTTEPRHKRGVQKLFTLLKDRGFIYKGSYTGQYCVFDELYVDGVPGGACPDCGRPTETVSEENYYFKLSAFERPLLEYYEAHPEFIQPETRRNEVISFVRGGLRDLSVSRTSFDWGIPVAGDEKHVVYVWLDALANYITALGWGSDDEADKARFAKYWPADVHIIGKEISRFHCVYWPAFLMAAGLPLPKQIVAHGWLLFEQSKMSKSRGNIVRAETILDVLGADALRYFLLREIVFGQDGSFSFDALVQRYNSDLANGYGNLASRTLAMIAKYFDGVVPPRLTTAMGDHAEPLLRGKDRPFLERVPELVQSVGIYISKFAFSQALEQIWAFIAELDGFITAEAPWKLSENDELQRLQREDVLYTAAESLRIITALLHPVLPEATARIWSQLGLGDISKADLKNIAWGGLQPGTKLGELGPVFPRADKEKIVRMQTMEDENNAARAAAQVETEAKVPAEKPAVDPATIPPKAQMASAYSSSGDSHESELPKPVVPAPPAPTPAATPAAVPATEDVLEKQHITIDDFTKVELRVAQIKVAERIPKADKLLRLEVDLGYEQRQILAGIAEFYTPESLVGRKVVIVANLAPRKMRGLESNGMLLAASLEGGKPVLASFLEEVELGARLK